SRDDAHQRGAAEERTLRQARGAHELRHDVQSDGDQCRRRRTRREALSLAVPFAGVPRERSPGVRLTARAARATIAAWSEEAPVACAPAARRWLRACSSPAAAALRPRVSRPRTSSPPTPPI